MAMAVRAQLALHSAAAFPSGLSSSSSSDSAPSCSTVRPSSSSSGRTRVTGGVAARWVSRTPQELSCIRIEKITQSSSRGQRLHPGRSGGSFVGCRATYGALTPELKTALDSFISSNKVVLFMKGNRNFPQCGFSNTCIQILNQCNVPYETVNILEDDSLRQGVKEYSKWPTYPQLYIDGEFYGGCDITLEAFKSGDLKEAIDKAMVS